MKFYKYFRIVEKCVEIVEKWGKYKDRNTVVNIWMSSGDIMESMHDVGIKILNHRTNSYFNEIAKLCVEIVLDMTE